MPKLYDFILDEPGAKALIEVLDEVDEDLVEMEAVMGTFPTDPEMVTVTERRLTIEEVQQRLSSIKTVIQQWKDQQRNGPMISFEVRYDLTEPLQNALVSQVAYATRQRDGYARLLASVPDNQEIKDAYNGYHRQVVVLEEVMRQVGRHV